MLFAKPRVPVEIINDIDGQVVNFFRMLRDSLDMFLDLWRVRSNDWKGLYGARHTVPERPCEAAGRGREIEPKS